jgi:transposase
MQKVQKTYTQEFKREAVRLAQTSGKSIAQVARELGISDSAIHQWRKELAEHGPEAFPGSGHQAALEEENRRLKRELERTRQERDILKKLGWQTGLEEDILQSRQVGSGILAKAQLLAARLPPRGELFTHHKPRLRILQVECTR